MLQLSRYVGWGLVMGLLLGAGRVLLLDPSEGWGAEVLEKLVTVEGGEIFYREAGDPSRKPTLLLLPDLPLSSLLYQDLLSVLAKAHHVIALDVYGSGKSWKPLEADYRADAQSRHLKKFLDAIQVSEVVLWVPGLSGLMGFDFAARYPNQIKGLIIVNTSIFPDKLTPPAGPPSVIRRSVFTDMSTNVRERMEFLGSKEFFKMLFAQANTAASVNTEDLAEKFAEDYKAREAREALLKLLRGWFDSLSSSSVAAVQNWWRSSEVPAWLIFSEDPRRTSGKLWNPLFGNQGDYFREARQHVTYLHKSGGHFLVLEDPVGLAEEVSRFMEEASRGRETDR